MFSLRVTGYVLLSVLLLSTWVGTALVTVSELSAGHHVPLYATVGLAWILVLLLYLPLTITFFVQQLQDAL